MNPDDIPEIHPTGLSTALLRLFGGLDAAAVLEIGRELEVVEIRGGARLMRQGDAPDGLYVVIDGRLQAVEESQDGAETVLGEIPEGESVGEMALLTGEPRSASIYATRDSLLVRLSNEAFARLARRYPDLAINLSKLVIRRLREAGRAQDPPPRVRNVAVVFATPEVETEPFMERLECALGAAGPTLRVGSRRLGPLIGHTAPGEVEPPDAARLGAWLNEQGRAHRFVLYEADRQWSDWTRRCVRQADRVLVVARSGQPPALGEVESRLFDAGTRSRRVRCDLVLVHGDGSEPQGTSRWLESRAVDAHHHLRWNRDADFERLARHLEGRAVGIVFSGGGAKGLAHVGVVRAMSEAGVPLDIAGGTSIGAIIAAGVSSGWDAETLHERSRAAFTRDNPLNDFSIPPMVSLVRGKKMDALLRDNFGLGDIEDMWLPFFCVSSDLSDAQIAVHRRGPLWKALRASASLPGILPPVVYGDSLHVDGGTFDNFPVDVMRRSGAGHVIASDLALQKRYRLDYGEVPSAWRILLDRYLTRHRSLKVPGIMTVLFRATILGGLDRGREAARRADVYLRSPVERIGFLGWNDCDAAAEIGYRHAKEQLERGMWPPGDVPD